MRAWQLAAAFGGSRQALEALLRDDRLTQYLGGADQVGQLLGAKARRRLRARLPAALAAVVLSDTPAGLPPRSAAAEEGWSKPMPWRQHPDPPAVLRAYLDRLKAEVERTGDADRGTRVALSWLAWLVRGAVSRALRAVLLVCMAPLGLAILALLSLGVARGRRRGMRRIRRAAHALGAADGLLMDRQSGAGVFGEGPYWAVVTTQRPGAATEVAAALLERAISAGYQRDIAAVHEWGFSFPGSAAMSGVSVRVVGEGQLLSENGELGYPLHRVPGRRGASPVFVGRPSCLLGPGTAEVRGWKFSYSLIVPAIVPVGSSVVVVSLNAQRPSR